MYEVKLLHIADIHLGSVFSGLTPDLARMRRNESTHTCLRALKDAANCDLLLLPGDVFNTGITSVTLIDLFLDTISSLKIPVFYSCGNHDSYYTDTIKYCISGCPDNLHIFSPDEITDFTLDDLKVKVYGGSFSSERCYTPMLDSSLVLDENYINLLCIHGDTAHGPFNHIDTNIIKKIGFDYAALGHIHQFDGFKKYGSCSMAYSGILEGRGYDECGDKGYIKGIITKNYTDLKFYPISTRNYVDEKIDISDFKNEYEILDIINSFCPKNNEICRFTLVGENNFSSGIDTEFLKSGCNAFSTEITDLAVPVIYPEDYIGYSGIKGECAKETIKLLDNSLDENNKQTIIKAFSTLVDLFENR